MKCKHCQSNQLIKKGKRNYKQRYQCKVCNKFQQDLYTYNLFKKSDNRLILSLNSEGVGISGLTRHLGYSKATIVRHIRALALKVRRPILFERNQIYEVDELWTFVSACTKRQTVWITYAINRKTKQVIDFVVGARSSENLGKIISKLKLLQPKKIVTDKYSAYTKLVEPVYHETAKSANNRIERANLNLRTHIKRLSRKTICYSKSAQMLEAVLLLYFFWINWRMVRP